MTPTNGNPLFNQLLNQPGAQQFLQQFRNQDPRQLVYNLAQKRGIPTQQIQQLYNQIISPNNSGAGPGPGNPLWR